MHDPTILNMQSSNFLKLQVDKWKKKNVTWRHHSNPKPTFIINCSYCWWERRQMSGRCVAPPTKQLIISWRQGEGAHWETTPFTSISWNPARIFVFIKIKALPRPDDSDWCLVWGGNFISYGSLQPVLFRIKLSLLFFCTESLLAHWQQKHSSSFILSVTCRNQQCHFTLTG